MADSHHLDVLFFYFPSGRDASTVLEKPFNGLVSAPGTCYLWNSRRPRLVETLVDGAPHGVSFSLGSRARQHFRSGNSPIKPPETQFFYFLPLLILSSLGMRLYNPKIVTQHLDHLGRWSMRSPPKDLTRARSQNLKQD